MRTKKSSRLVGRGLLLFAVLAIHSQVVACDCVPITEEEAFARAEQVFTGRVVTVNRMPDALRGVILEVHFDIEDIEKGDVSSRTIVYTGADTGGCGYPMGQLQRYRVFAAEFEGRLWTSLCSNNSLVPHAQDLDADGIPNLWEEQHGFDPENLLDAREDVDGDGLNAMEEYIRGTNPSLPDTDGDRFLDGLETSFNTDPLDPESPGEKSIPLSPSMMQHALRGKRLDFTFDIPPWYQLGFQFSTDLKLWRTKRITIQRDMAFTSAILNQPTVYYRAVLTPLADLFVLHGHRGDSRIADGPAIQITDETPKDLQLASFRLNDAWIVDDDLVLSVVHSRSFAGQDVRVLMDSTISGVSLKEVNLYVQIPELNTASSSSTRTLRFDLEPVKELVGDHDIRIKVHGHFFADVRNARTEIVRFVRH